MASKDTQTGEQKTPEEIGKELAESLAQADPADDEQPKPEAAAKAPRKQAEKKDEPKPEKAEAEKKAPKAKALKLNEIEGEVKDGEKIRIGVEVWGGANKGGTIIAPFVVPKKWIIAGPVARPDWVHAINIDTPDRTLCRLPTDWRSGRATYPDDAYITCQPCARRLIAVKKLDPKVHAQRKAARDAARKAAADRQAADKKAAADKAKADADAKKASAPARPSAPVETKAADKEAKPDPKPRRSRKAA